MTNKQIKIRVGSFYDVADLAFAGQEITFNYQEYNIRAIGEYPFMVLKEIREYLEKKNIMLIINGSRIDVYPSGMSLVGDNAYVQKIGEPSLLNDLVNIFDETDMIQLIGTVEEQIEYHKNWIKSLH
jgi:hypothetical protein